MSPSFTVTAILIAVQLVGLVSVVMARASEGRLAERIGHLMFWLCLLAVGTATVSGAISGHWLWPMCGFTLGTMVVGALFEHREPAVEHY